MPRNEARIFTSIWRDPHFTALPPGPQRLYMFLLSQDDLSYCGVMPLREARWAAKASGMTADEIRQDLKALEASGRQFVVMDEAAGELFVRSLMRRDRIWMQPNLLKLARESAEQIESQQIRSVMLAELRRLPLDETPSAQVKTLVGEFVQYLEQGNAYPTAYPPPNPEQNPDDGSTHAPDPDPTDKDYACARGTGEGYVGSDGSPDPRTPEPQNSLTAQTRKNGTRLPDDFTVTADMVTWFRQNCPHVDGKREIERFVDYWKSKPGKEGRKLDWVRTWRNWMRTAEDRAAPRIRGTPSVPESAADQRRADVARLRELDRQQREDRQTVIPGSVVA